MKKIFAIVLAAVLALSCMACGNSGKDNTESSGNFTVKDFLDSKGFKEGAILKVRVKSIDNPVWATVEDETGEVKLFGVTVDGEFKPFEEAGIKAGMTISIADGKYNEYEGTVEITEARLVSVD